MIHYFILYVWRAKISSAIRRKKKCKFGRTLVYLNHLLFEAELVKEWMFNGSRNLDWLKMILGALALAQNSEPRWWSSEDCAASAAGRSEIFLDLVLLKGTP